MSIFGAILYYMFSFISIGTWNGWTSIIFGDEPKKQLLNVIRNNGLMRGKLLA